MIEPHRLCLSIKGTIHLAPDKYSKKGEQWVYQRSAPFACNVEYISGVRVQKRRQPIAYNPKTPAQLAQRKKMKAAVLAWQGMNRAQRDLWIPEGNRRKILPYMAFCSDYLLNYKEQQQGTIWDGGLTTWDGGLTTWDLAQGTMWDGGLTTWDGGLTTWDLAQGTMWDGGLTTCDGGSTKWDLNL